MPDLPEERPEPKPDPAVLDQNRRPARRVGRRNYVDRALEPDGRKSDPKELPPGRFVTK